MSEMICCKIRGAMAWLWRRAQSGPRGRCRVEEEGSRNPCSTTDASIQDVANVKIYGSRAGRSLRGRTIALDGSYINPGSRDLIKKLYSQSRPLSTSYRAFVRGFRFLYKHQSDPDHPIEHSHTKTGDY
jgi:hypothetical protein